MTTIHDIPGEILTVIFKYLDFVDLEQCQQVCQSWYHPAHTLRLETLYVTSIKQFIKTIDFNPQPAYLNAVKLICIYKLSDFQPVDIDKVFCRFPNLERVAVFDCLRIFKEFDDQTCQTILNKCPKLNVFVATERNTDVYREMVPKLRLLLTSIAMDKFSLVSPLNFISEYPRVQDMTGHDHMFRKYECWMPYVEVMPRLKVFRITALQNDQEDFLTAYLSTKSSEQRDIIVERLSKITRVEYHGNKFCVNSMTFALEYLTGLTDINMSTLECDGWTDEQWRSCVDVLEWACKKDASFAFTDMQLQSLSRYMPSLVDRVFKKTDLLKKQLRVEIRDLKLITMKIRIFHSRLLQLTLSGSEENIVSLLNGPINTVDLNLFDLAADKNINIPKGFPPVKKVNLET